MENISNTKPFLSPFHVQKGHFLDQNCIFLEEQNEQRRKMDGRIAVLRPFQQYFSHVWTMEG